MTQIGRSSRRHDIVLPDRDGARVSLAWAAVSDKGHRRAVNEDSLLARSPIFAVADGMGGHTAGDFASAAVVTRLAEQLGSGFVAQDAVSDALRAAVDDMSRGVGLTDLGTGTTVSGIALTLHDGEAYWLVFNIGDSRVYQLLDGTLDQLTVDHSIVQQLLDAGMITPAEAEVHPHSNVITRAVGFNEDPVPDFWLIPISAGARLLVCSDGLTKELTEHGVRHFLSIGDSPADAANRLMEAALGNGGRDNVSVIVVDVLETPESSAGRPRTGGRRRARSGPVTA
ncbi:PP2C family protein-serine/threonine phosphatase [Gryllotalpicola ginsengisoli]|uniref:PP2C family protein-serine/threonine phosphatase n=1 Tax=Gryllotalpicola ginsengisoli TaxID=444608 RepID=UPI0003B4B2F0|nr:protein phosphatase 2C domain-containing protein [Gryllotalpicola ginsengisoli]